MKRPIADDMTLDLDTHHVRREVPLLHITVRGNLTLANMTALVELYQALVEEQGFLLLLMDVHDSTGMDMAARKIVTGWSAAHAKRVWSGVVGANAFVRATMNMFNRAAKAMGKSEPGLMFFADEAAARAWLLERYDVVRAAK